MTQDTYVQLATHFDRHFKDPRGLEYLTGNQVVGRLNDVLGPGGWMFTVREHGYDEESDEVWVLGSLNATIDGAVTCREQFGSQKHNRRRADNKVIDYGFDLKGAATDALKKCATLIGVGLYLSEKEGGIVQQEAHVPIKDQTPEDDRDIVRTADDPLWKSWLVLLGKAEAAHIKVPEVRLPVDRNDLKETGAQLKASILVGAR